MYLSVDVLPTYIISSMRKFFKGECHVTRVFEHSVLILMLSGTLDFYEDNNHITLKSGEYYIQRPNLFQEGRFPSDSPEYSYIHFKGTYSENEGLPLRGNFDSNDLIPHILELEAMEQSGFATKYKKNASFYTIIDHLIQKNNELKQGLPHRVAEFLHKNYTHPVSLSELEKNFLYTSNHIIKSLKETFGFTPHQYVTKLRIQCAKHLLLTTDRSTETIAYESGYKDYSVFYRNFEALTGMSPAIWRKNTDYEA